MTEPSFTQRKNPHNTSFWPIQLFLDGAHELPVPDIRQELARRGFNSVDGKTFKRTIYLANSSNNFLLLHVGSVGPVKINAPDSLRPGGSGVMEFIYTPDSSSPLPENVNFELAFSVEVVKPE